MNPHEGVDTIILEPTRELAVQVDQQLEGFSYFPPVSSIPIYGGRDGHSMEMEMRALKKGADIIVATPGRFLAHLQLGYVKLDQVRYLVLDEADRNGARLPVTALVDQFYKDVVARGGDRWDTSSLIRLLR